MRVGILGPVELRGPDGAAVAVPGPRARALLAVLAMQVGTIVSTTRLLDDVYGDEVPNNAANALQSQVSRLRQALRSADLADAVEFHAGGYRLALDADEVDAHRFLRLAAEGRAALAGNDPRTARALLREAEDLWRGPAAAELESARLDATEDRIEAELRLGAPAGVLTELRALVAAHPLRERLHGQLVRALHAGNRTPEALAAYEDARRTLAEELGVDPSPELAATHLAILRDEAPRPSAPPAQLTSFVGRDGELRRLAELLGTTRLVTLTGPGGTGKTRLAIEAAAAQQGEVCFVKLAPLSDPPDVEHAVLTALGLREVTMPVRGHGSQTSTVERIVTALAERPMLLVLDNCEHLIGAAATLADTLLAECPALRILATSREPLDITGETLLPVPQLAADPAVRLFADRAAAGRADFVLDESTLPEVRQICAALDGLPLAIELAAARARQVSTAEIAARLDDRFSLLSQGSRTAASRHRTLRAVVEWSWGLLDDAERELARLLTVFAGGATRQAVDAVRLRPSTMDLLARLADKSFVEREGERFRMLQTIHAFCAERLAEAGEAGQARRAHAQYFLRLAQEAAPHLVQATQLDWLSMLDTERDNLHAALRWATEADQRLALRLTSALVPYWWMRGRRSEGAQLAAQLLRRIGDEAPEGFAEEYAICVLNAAFATQPPPNLAERIAHAERIVLATAETPKQPFVTVLHAVIAGPPTNNKEIEERLNITLRLDPWTAGLVPMGTGMLAMFRGELDTAEAELRAAEHRFRVLGERWGLSMTLGTLGQVETRRGNPAPALELTNEALRLADELGATLEIADLYAQRADAYLVAGAPEQAAADYRLSAELATRAGSAEKAAVARLGLAELALRRGASAEATDIAEHALSVSSLARFELADARLRAWHLLSRVAAAEGYPERERELLVRIATTALDEGNPQYASVALDRLAWLAVHAGDAVRAARLFGAARRTYRAPGPTGLAERLREALGEKRFNQEQASGEALDAAAVRELADGQRQHAVRQR